MNKFALLTLAVAAVAYPQATVGLRPAVSNAPAPSAATLSHDVEAARPLLGYLTDETNLLYSVVGSAANAFWGEPLSLPDSTAKAFLPPRQQYALLASDAGLSIARLSRAAVYPGAVIAGAMTRPEQVSFSPSGHAAALFSSAESRIQVITYLAGHAEVSWSLSIANPAELQRFAISDDGKTLVAAFAHQPVVYSLSGAGFLPLAANYWPDAWTFLPNSHSLVLSDRTQKAIVLLPQIESVPIAARVLASGGLDATLLSPNKQGTHLLAVAVETSESWSIDLLTGTIAALPVKGRIDSLTLLRDGQTFLVSMKASPEVLTLSGSSAQASATNISH